ncbi:uncharacterized protein [Choristoneura fumiferana]|uniref:uncharacterized protein n=1 Tax=Choristoneura fumiferana TaxID=7141 RepID=UPI003D1578C6
MRYYKLCLTLMIACVSLSNACSVKEANRYLDNALDDLRDIEIEVTSLKAVIDNHMRIERKLDLILVKMFPKKLRGKWKPLDTLLNKGRRTTRRPRGKKLSLNKKYNKKQRPARRLEDSSYEDK